MDFSGYDPPSAMLEDEATGGGATSYIDPNSAVEGTIRTNRDLRIEGRLNGKISCDGVLMVAEGAVVDAEIDAASIIVAGEMSGTVRCRGRLEIRTSGIVRGDVKTGALVILEGARYEGQIAMEERDVAEEEYVAPAPEMEEDPDVAASGGYSFLRRFAPEEDEAEPVDDDQKP